MKRDGERRKGGRVRREEQVTKRRTGTEMTGKVMCGSGREGGQIQEGMAFS